MKIYTTFIFASLLSAFSPTSQAEGSLYAGVAIGSSSYGYDNIDPAAATKLFVGYQIDEKISIEATAFDSGDADITILPGFTLNSNGVNVTVFYCLPSSVNNLTVMVGGGIYSFDTTAEAFGLTIGSESSSGLSLAAGIELTLNDNLALRADIDLFSGVKDFDQNQGIDSINFGVVVHF